MRVALSEVLIALSAREENGGKCLSDIEIYPRGALLLLIRKSPRDGQPSSQMAEEYRYYENDKEYVFKAKEGSLQVFLAQE